MLPDKFFEAFAETGEKPPSADPEDPEPKTYTAAEVDALVNERVAEAVEEIKKTLSTPEDPAGKEPDHGKEGSNENV